MEVSNGNQLIHSQVIKSFGHWHRVADGFGRAISADDWREQRPGIGVQVILIFNGNGLAGECWDVKVDRIFGYTWVQHPITSHTVSFDRIWIRRVVYEEAG